MKDRLARLSETLGVPDISPALSTFISTMIAAGIGPTAAKDLITRGYQLQLLEGSARSSEPDVPVQATDNKPSYEDLEAELHLLEEVCAFYANDEDRYIRSRGEPYGSIPTEVGMKARSARHRFNEREASAEADAGIEPA